MANIHYVIAGSSPDYLPRAEFEMAVKQIEEKMNLGESVMSGGGTLCDFYYGNSPVGFANIMSESGVGDFPTAIRLTAPDKSGLLALTESLGTPYDEDRVDVE